MRFYTFLIILNIIKSQYLTQTEFVQKTMSVIALYKEIDYKYEIKKQILEAIHDTMKYDDINKLILFVSVALQKTSFLDILEDKKDTFKYKSRGLLKIEGLKNYQLLNKYSKTCTFDYISDPQVLSTIRTNVIKDCVEYFDRAVDFNYTIDNYIIKYEDECSTDLVEIYQYLKQYFCKSRVSN